MSAGAGWQDYAPQGWQDYQEQPKPPSALSRFWSGAKAGTGGENALNTPVDPEHPISSNAMIPGAGVYRDIKSGNYAGAAGRVLGPAAELAPMFLGGSSGGEAEVPPAQPSALKMRVQGVGKLAAQDAASHIPFAGRLVRRPSLGDYWKAATAEAPPVEPPVYPGAHLPATPPNEVLNPSLVSPSRNLPGNIGKEVIGPWPKPAESIPPRSGLALPSGKNPLMLPERTAAIPLPESTPVPRQPIHGTTPSSPLPPLRTGNVAPADPWGNLKFDSAAQTQAAQELGSTGHPQFLERAQAIKQNLMNAPWTPPRAQTQWPPVGSTQDLFETQGIQENIRNQADSEMDALRKRGNEEGYARNTKQGKTKGELTETAAKPVKLTKTPGVKASGTAYPSVTSEEDLIPLLKRSIELAQKAKKK